ncbi:hypothetical protein L3X38_002480 [Prunus dulcis]|uniref:Uncharacterized protein n=1 Tax=Prunus dulcis TaxID=3755 RepID=A0AAD4WY71_PRUDU|nr:hypothetical protein L3X38_002480 [Prunus dulcis]
MDPLGSANCNSLSNEKEKEDEVELVKSLVSAKSGGDCEKSDNGGRVTKGGEISEEKKQQYFRVKRKKGKVAKVRKAEYRHIKGVDGVAEGAKDPAAGKQPRDDDDGIVMAALDKRMRGLEAAIHHVMGDESELPPFDLEPHPKLPLGMEELFPADVEDIDFVEVRRQKKEVTLAIHRHEVSLVNAFLTEVKMDAGELAQTKATDFSDRVQKTILSSANMYLTLAKAGKEVALARRQMETAKAATAEAQAVIWEKNQRSSANAAVYPDFEANAGAEGSDSDRAKDAE